MDAANFFGPQGLPAAGDPNDWQAQQQRGMAAMLLRQMPTNQGQMHNGGYAAQPESAYAVKIAQALQQGMKNYQQASPTPQAPMPGQTPQWGANVGVLPNYLGGG